jgi:hypothetical protein
MASPVILAVAGALLAGVPGSGTTTPPNEKLTDAESFSANAGRVLGAASECEDISDEQINKATSRIGDAIEHLISDDDELASAQEMFLQGITEGGEAIKSGSTDCRRAAAALAEMEHDLPR